MNYNLIKDVILLIQQYEIETTNYSNSDNNIDDFKKWIAADYCADRVQAEPEWEGKAQGRSAESAINTLLVHINRYAKNYSKSAIIDSEFSTQEEFIYLINLKNFGEMTKMELIKKNVHDKPAGIKIINRLIAQGWVVQKDSNIDKRSKVVKITRKGLKCLGEQMEKIRAAAQIVTGDLTNNEKLELIRLLSKLNNFHKPIYEKNIGSKNLLNEFLKSQKQ